MSKRTEKAAKAEVTAPVEEEQRPAAPEVDVSPPKTVADFAQPVEAPEIETEDAIVPDDDPVPLPEPENDEPHTYEVLAGALLLEHDRHISMLVRGDQIVARPSEGQIVGLLNNQLIRLVEE